ncbi:CAP domain-containing protein [Nocardioides sp. Y6]|uniref:CAP domain-containing protein n=1 Tax=Nocardioides malaquae TaxID=2773426 RepID=A0ABR9RQD5_9ACTN|nr:CAP domain-containing protein [Nocardioides malaquae]MBE7323785.1 CAP domain-containing protein [Nocardioides malaquae]
MQPTLGDVVVTHMPHSLLARSASRLATLVTVCALTMTVLVVAPTAPAEAATGAQKYSRSAQKATNAVRVKRDRVRLTGDRCLRQHARRHARAMARQGSIWHQDMQAVLEACDLTMVGENVAMGYPTGRAAVRKGWMKSPGHRANILRRQYRLGVVAAAKGDDGLWYAAQLFGRR